MRQLPLHLEHRQLLGREDFLVSASNIEAVEWIDSYPEWFDLPGVLVVGAKASGKTHVLWLFGEKSGAKIYNAAELAAEAFSDIVPEHSALAVDDIDAVARNAAGEESLLHVVNYAGEVGTKLFMTASAPVAGIGFASADLKTRLLQMPVANIYTPDDDLLKALIVKQFMERGISVSANVVEWLSGVVPRNASCINELVEVADMAASEERRNITIPFLKKIIDKIEE
jgi:chromosomal replication initiation ATPase DnaA